MHLAQVNVAKLLKPIDHPDIAEFVDNVDRINALAEGHPGFVWRMSGDYENEEATRIFGDPMLLINYSIWETPEDLKNFVYRSGHMEVFRKKSNWFEQPKKSPLAMWWVKPGEIPSIEEAKRRLELLHDQGESEEVFTFKRIIKKH